MAKPFTAFIQNQVQGAFPKNLLLRLEVEITQEAD